GRNVGRRLALLARPLFFFLLLRIGDELADAATFKQSVELRPIALLPLVGLRAAPKRTIAARLTMGGSVLLRIALAPTFLGPVVVVRHAAFWKERVSSRPRRRRGGFRRTRCVAEPCRVPNSSRSGR